MQIPVKKIHPFRLELVFGTILTTLVVKKGRGGEGGKNCKTQIFAIIITNCPASTMLHFILKKIVDNAKNNKVERCPF